jgi:transposase
LLKDRATKILSDWLKNYKNIELVTRDSANSYLKSINDTLYSAIQISDKWHLLKNMLDALNSILQSQCTIDVTIGNTQKPKEENLINVKPTQ